MNIKKSIPKEIINKIISLEEIKFATPNYTRWYPYLEMQRNRLAISTVAVKRGKGFVGKKKPTLFIKKVAIHILGMEKCYCCKDIYFTQMAGYFVDYNDEINVDTLKTRKIINKNSNNWWKCDNKYFRLFKNFKIVNPEFLNTIEEFKYCAWNGESDLLDYLTLYQTNPQIEFISKLIGSKYAVSKQLITLAKKDKKFIQWLNQNKEEIKSNSYKYNIPIILNAYRERITLEEALLDYENLQKLKRLVDYKKGKGLISLYKTLDKNGKGKLT